MAKETANERVRKAISWLIDNGYATSQRAIADKMMYSPSTLSLILNGKVNVKERFARTLSQMSKDRINEEWILSGDGGMINTDKVVGEEIKSRAYGVTLEDIVRSRLKLEHTIADACALFSDEVGIPVSHINVSYKTLDRGYIQYDVRVPVEIPSLGSTAECKDYKLKEQNYGSSEDLPPVEFEEAFISACLKDSSIIDRTKKYLFPEMFSDKKLGVIYDTMNTMRSNRLTVTVEDLVPYINEYVYGGNAVTDEKYLRQLENKTFNSDHAEFYADCIYNYAIRHDAKKWADIMGLFPKESTIIDPSIKEAYAKMQEKENYEKLCRATGVSDD